ncbi:MAG: ATP-dependent DNA helicase RecG [Planctomycetales bacterium]|nr:ATP-dependent DNA helicase RecG [Planctomycetales bacterium]NIM09968.1 ATP-dependent DNA helicase RecG [Planctomycetales bacterium]NIN09406.1 ATP-dependent DNA helicase RecG [Planctomycetales bacterium]NIN78513.1 ATP-dependent DNA helicase RecG [Planctomycetales bacterium]NIO35706.1 ATP-dependent DNA helicase RecG [Planctomycetales bacterium]
MANPHDTAVEQVLATPVQFMKKVGPRRAELFARLDLHTARDVLFFFPRDYQDLTDVRPIAGLEDGLLVSVLACVEEVELRETGTGRSILGVLVREGEDFLRAIWFNQPYMQHRLLPGQQVLLSGKARLRGMQWEMAHPRVQTIDTSDGLPEGRRLPVYRLTEGLHQGQVRRVVESALQVYGGAVEEIFSEEFLVQHQLLPIHEALHEIHFPTSSEALQRARHRFIYQELLLLQLALVLRRNVRADLGTAPRLPVDAKIDARIRRRFPFELTEGQEAAVGEIAADMKQACPMNRLLQGDVGSGKTVVALYATLLAVAHRHQVAIMAPTEVLARQHARVLGDFLQASQVRTALLSGGIPVAQRRLVLDAMAAGDVDVVIGTHALIQSGAEFARLGLVIIDEQHKFGVQQRAVLRQAETQPHYLVMTATPIPRTVTMALFGDLDVSTMRDFPPGRQPVHTYLGTPQQRAQWWEFFRNKLREGRQGYVITPLIEESEQWNVTSLAEAFEELANGELEAFRLGLIHGRQAASEKDRVMADFHSGKIQVLVGTTVVEVGVDVPNATLMTIEGAERFGLAQLHQLRGRIVRGAYPGYCCLFAEPASEEARQRLEAFAASTDGFELAEIDFRLRGPGDLFGTRQHGLPPLRVADLVRDADLVEVARQDAITLLAKDPGMVDPALALLRKRVLLRYGKVLDLGDVG